jgi:hypothetical protein
MQTVTINLDEQTAQWAQAWAARSNSTLSRLMADLLAERMRQEIDYEAAEQRFLSREPVRLRDVGAPYPERDALHDRQGLR